MEQYKETCDKLRKSFYVDDFVTSVDDEDVAKKSYREASLILKGASMTLRKWSCNSDSVRRCFSTDEAYVGL